MIFPIILLTFILSGCLSNPVQEELLSYLNEELPKITKLEADAITAYESVTGANYSTDQELYNVLLDSVVPTYQEFVDKLEGITLDTEEVRGVHEEYIEGANLQYNAFIKVITALEQQDRAMIEEANVMLDEARKILRDFKYNVEKLASEHNIELTDTLE